MAALPLTGCAGHGLVSALLVCALLCGCLQSATEEEAEHIIPAHRPNSLRHATWQLVTRWQQFAPIDEPARQAVAKWQQEPLVPSASVDIAAAELSDIVRWLPEVAAETELNRSQWERVASLAEQLEAHLPALQKPKGPEGAPTNAGSASQGPGQVSGLLVELVKQAQADVSYEELIQARDSQRQHLPQLIHTNPATTEQPATTADAVPTTNGAAQ